MMAIIVGEEEVAGKVTDEEKFVGDTGHHDVHRFAGRRGRFSMSASAMHISSRSMTKRRAHISRATR